MQEFLLNLESNIFKLHQDLVNGQWVADPYTAFYVRDPKLRHIHKASVRDRLLYQAIYQILYKVFDPHFIFDSYSCRDNKGLHKGFKRLEFFIRKSTQNYNKTSYVLKCDVKKFFDTISHEILYYLISKKVTDKNILSLVENILASFGKTEGVGLPLGNVTSQLFANIYLNELDQFIKHGLKAKYYARYCDDFVIIDSDAEKLKSFVVQIKEFLHIKLRLNLHPEKISIRKATQGIDFLGFVSMPGHNLLRTKTKNRIIRKIKKLVEEDDRKKIKLSLPSYLGILKHTQGQKIEQIIFDLIFPVFAEELSICGEMIGCILYAIKKYSQKYASELTPSSPFEFHDQFLAF